MNRLRILVGDDHALVLAGIRELLQHKHDVIGSATDGNQAVQQALQFRPDVVVLDISMPGMNGFEAGRLILEALPRTHVIFLSMHTNPSYVRKALQMKAKAYVLKSGVLEELLDAVEAVVAGKVYISPGMGLDVPDSMDGKRDGEKKPIEALTARQLQILQWIVEGLRSKEIAHAAGISIKTVDFHRARIMSKLGAHSLAELVRIAMEQGLISFSPPNVD